MGTPLLEIKDLYVEYKTGRAVSYALNGVNLTIEQGEAFGLVGETGAGKTTTALSTMNLLPDNIGFIKSGDVRFKGQDVLKMNRKELTELRGDKISMIFQNPLTSLNPVFTIGEQIAMVLRKHRGLGNAEAMKQAGDLLEMVNIRRDRLKDYPHQFSGGMRQRVGIAAALACDPELLIADEPTTALDVTIQAQILELMKDLQVKRSSSLLMITHSLGIIAETCQKVAIIYAGTILEVGTVQDVFVHPTHPYTQGLLGAIPKLTGPRERLTNIPGIVVNSQNLPSGCKFHPRCKECTEQCRNAAPPMVDIGGRHCVACWKVKEATK